MGSESLIELEHFTCGTKITFKPSLDPNSTPTTNQLPRKRNLKVKRVKENKTAESKGSRNRNRKELRDTDVEDFRKSLPNIKFHSKSPMLDFFKRQPIGLWIQPYSRTSTWT